MSNIVSDNKRIARNTIMLYIRLLVMMTVTFYTSRVVLQVLGVSDFGLYNVICGAVTLFAFVNGSMSGCTQRFLSIAIGKNDSSLSKKTFGVALTLHTGIAIFFFIVMEIIGFFLIGYVLNIPEGRYDTSFFIYHISLLTFCVNFLCVPFEAAIIAHERMDFYAYLSIFDVLAKLGILYLLRLFPSIDSLRLYSILLLLVASSLWTIYVIYSCRKFEMCSLRFSTEKELLKEMTSYTFWNTLGHVSYIISTQGYNIIFNIFFGTTINAARGIAVQVSGAVSKFTQNFQLAFFPQIVKLYTMDEREKMLNLVMNATIFSFYLVLFFGIPLFLCIDFVLDIWLTEVPEYTSLFVKVLLVQILISSLDVSADRAVVATGRVKSMNLLNTCNQIFFLVVSYIILKMGIDIMIVMPIMILPTVVLYAYTLFLLKRYLQLDILVYCKRVFVPCVKVLILSSALPIFCNIFFPRDVLYSLIMIGICVITTIISILYGLGSEMREKLFAVIKNKIRLS